MVHIVYMCDSLNDLIKYFLKKEDTFERKMGFCLEWIWARDKGRETKMASILQQAVLKFKTTREQSKVKIYKVWSMLILCYFQDL